MEDARERLAAARVARLATGGADGPHLVPFVFVLVGDVIYSCVDHKPKRTNDLRRLRNIADDPRVSVLVDHYSDEWDELWWVRVDGRAAVVGADDPVGVGAIDALADKYPQYRIRRPVGPAIVIDDLRWRSWTARS